MNEVQVVLVDVPLAFRGGAVPEADGSYTVYLNARYSAEERRTIFNHEVAHLLKGHHTLGGKSIQTLEAEADDNAALSQTIRRAEENGLPLGVPLLPRRSPFDDALEALQKERARIWRALLTSPETDDP